MNSRHSIIVPVVGYAIANILMAFLGWSLYDPLHLIEPSPLLDGIQLFQQLLFACSFIAFATLRFHRRSLSLFALSALGASLLVLGYAAFLFATAHETLNMGCLILSSACLSISRSMMLAIWIALIALTVPDRACAAIAGGWVLGGVVLTANAQLNLGDMKTQLVLPLLIAAEAALTLFCAHRVAYRDSLRLQAPTLQTEETCPPHEEERKALMDVFRDTWMLVVFMAGLNFVCTNLFFLLSPVSLEFNLDVDFIQSLGKLIVAIALAFLWPRLIALRTCQKVLQGLYLIVITCSLFLPLFGRLAFLTVGIAATSATAAATIILSMLCVKESLAKNLDPTVVFPACMGVFYFGMWLGYLTGTVSYQQSDYELSLFYFGVACVSIYLLSIALFIFSLLTSRVNERRLLADQSIRVETEIDHVARRCDELSDAYDLSPREREVFALIAQGRDAYYISKKLFISENTVRTHVKNIYRKAGISKRQELFELVND